MPGKKRRIAQPTTPNSYAHSSGFFVLLNSSFARVKPADTAPKTEMTSNAGLFDDGHTREFVVENVAAGALGGGLSRGLEVVYWHRAHKYCQ